MFRSSILLLLLAALQTTCPVISQEIHVSRKGNDKNPGSATRPVATLGAARDL